MRRGSQLPWTMLRATVAAIFVFVLAPILITAAVSFNGSQRSVFPPEGFALRWWAEAFSPRWLEPMWFSLQLALLTALLCAAIGTPLAFALVRREFGGKAVLEALVLGPLILPTLVTGIALLQFLHAVGLGALVGFWGLLIGHVVISLPFIVRTVAISLRGMPASLESAAASLGAPPLTVLGEVTLPVVSGGLRLRAFLHRRESLAVPRQPGRAAGDGRDPRLPRIRLRADPCRGVHDQSRHPSPRRGCAGALRADRRLPLCRKGTARWLRHCPRCASLGWNAASAASLPWPASASTWRRVSS
jgi:putative spermidine/putrescine transport system permease protein